MPLIKHKGYFTVLDQFFFFFFFLDILSYLISLCFIPHTRNYLKELLKAYNTLI